MFVCGECGWAQPTAGRCNDGTTLVPIGDDLLLGTNLGPYRIARLLGIGGMGRVYKGVHPQIGSRVAIKVLSRECTDRPDLVERFFAEARAVNLVNHEGIVNVLDLSVLPDGRPYIVMEYLDGAPLTALIEQARARGTPLPIGSVARIAVEVLDALGAAHAKGIVHRDLKPDNLYITPGGRPKILDFGIAKLQPELGGNSATHTGSLLGTPQYMAPEQASGRPVDARSDLYAIGCILYECLTLQRPFTGESLFDLLRKHIEEPVVPPRHWRPDLPPDVEHVILIALAKSPDERFGAAVAMSQALQHATAQLPPAQWAPITPSGSMAPARANPSWGARPSPVPPPPVSPSPLGQAATVPVAGAPSPVPAPSPRPTRARWPLAVGAVALLGGVAAIAAVATRGEGGDRPATETDPAPAHAAQVVPPEKRHPAPPAAEDVDPVEAMVLKHVDKELSAVDDQLARGLAPPAGPPRDAAVTIAAAPDAAPAPAPAGDAAPAPPPAAVEIPHSPDGWVVRRTLAPPPGFDPANVDVTAFTAWALAQGQREIADARFIRLDVDNVDATGHADLTAPSFAYSSGSITLRFVSPSHMPPDPKGHKPFGFEWKCEFRIEASPEEIEVRGDSMSCADAEPVRPPRCPVAGVWRRGAAKVPAGKTRASFLYRLLPTGAPGWDMDIKGALSVRFPDDCR